MKTRHNITAWLIAATSLFLIGCEHDEDQQAPARRSTMELLSFSGSFLEVEPWSTRADDYNFHFGSGYTDHLPNGYKSYNELHPSARPQDSNIGVFMTPGNINPAGDFIYRGEEGTGSSRVSVWKSSIIVEENKQYYIYGFMPKDGAATATISTLPTAVTTGPDEGYAAGAIIHVDNFESMTTADVSVIVGLRWATEDEKINGIPSSGSDVPLGHFSYLGRPEGENRLFVLLEHLYAGLHFATKVDPTYNALRTIRITKVELTAIGIKEKVNLTIELRANNTGTDPMTNVIYEPVAAGGTDKTIPLYEKTDAPDDLGVEVPDNEYKDFLGCMVPGSTDNFILTTTYDVYDKDTSVKPEGNLIRKGCVASNAINKNLIPSLSGLGAGELFTINLLIQPTFLYVLSEPDLDNPTIVVN